MENAFRLKFDRDLRWRTGVELYPVVCESSNGFKVTRTALESAYKKAQEENIRVKGLLINNPSNPLGTVLDRDTLHDIVRFVNDKNIHLVCDEIYAATKTFVSCARKMSSFELVSTQTQHLIAAMLTDQEFVGNFIKQSSERLRRRHESFTRGLAQVGIETLQSNGGLFVWMNLRNLHKEPTFAAELELWKMIINEMKLNVSPGCSFHCHEAGWFRVCFANMDDETMRVALMRIRTSVLQWKGMEAAAAKKQKQCRRNLKISLSFRRLDDCIISSPHSPMNSPLVQETNKHKLIKPWTEIPIHFTVDKRID
ncbi:1-aminocyclopropane-1-carboxylate synthase-like [Ipomoea triloba]|uniref:1-aminocyclopropane-1-carboxylate synthase-like n=1 Tax=Ipomoea triloba TaxID=35885 RepID=UPI00125E5CE0|nr:1-aminocyclopropane-1-carboxylate synthase-like [Ipomoea triloba]